MSHFIGTFGKIHPPKQTTSGNRKKRKKIYFCINISLKIHILGWGRGSRVERLLAHQVCPRPRILSSIITTKKSAHVRVKQTGVREHQPYALSSTYYEEQESAPPYGWGKARTSVLPSDSSPLPVFDYNQSLQCLSVFPASQQDYHPSTASN